MFVLYGTFLLMSFIGMLFIVSNLISAALIRVFDMIGCLSESPGKLY